MRFDRTVLALGALFAHVAAAQPPDVAPLSPQDVTTQVTRMVVFSIPFEAPATTYPRPTEVQLHVSEDEGRTWRLQARVDPARGSFSFRAPRDGTYWFAVRTLDETGVVHPTGPYRPELRVVVDTVAPKTILTAWREPDGRVRARWQIVEGLPKPDGIRLSYNTGSADENWRPIDVPPQAATDDEAPLTGETNWLPEIDAETLFVRAEIVDRAGNATVIEQEILDSKPEQAETIAAAAPTTTATAEPEDVAAPPPSAQAWPAEVAQTPSSAAPVDVAPSQPGNNAPLDSAPSTPQPGGGTFDLTMSGAPGPRGDIAVEELPEPTPSASSTGPTPQYSTSATNTPAALANAPIDQSSSVTANNATPGAETLPESSGTKAAFASLPRGVQPRMVRSRQFELAYDVEAVGPSGVSHIELWGTRDGGRNWLNFGAPADFRNPLQVTVEGEGLYGFRLVVHSASGLGGLPPRAGDLPDVWVGVDLTEPTARLTAVEQGAAERAGELSISWDVSDTMLAERPISLSFSSQPDGPWSTIASGLPNTGAYVWRLDNRVPDVIFVRLEARDEAGNVARVDHGRPISIYRQRPAARVIDVRPIVP